MRQPECGYTTTLPTAEDTLEGGGDDALTPTLKADALRLLREALACGPSKCGTSLLRLAPRPDLRLDALVQCERGLSGRRVLVGRHPLRTGGGLDLCSSAGRQGGNTEGPRLPPAGAAGPL